MFLLLLLLILLLLLLLQYYFWYICRFLIFTTATTTITTTSITMISLVSSTIPSPVASHHLLLPFSYLVRQNLSLFLSRWEIIMMIMIILMTMMMIMIILMIMMMIMIILIKIKVSIYWFALHNNLPGCVCVWGERGACVSACVHTYISASARVSEKKKLERKILFAAWVSRVRDMLANWLKMRVKSHKYLLKKMKDAFCSISFRSIWSWWPLPVLYEC